MHKGEFLLCPWIWKSHCKAVLFQLLNIKSITFDKKPHFLALLSFWTDSEAKFYFISKSYSKRFSSLASEVAWVTNLISRANERSHVWTIFAHKRFLSKHCIAAQSTYFWTFRLLENISLLEANIEVRGSIM